MNETYHNRELPCFERTHEPTQRYLTVLIASCVFNAVGTLTALFGNTLVIAGITTSPSLRSFNSNLIIVALAVSDLLKGSLIQTVFLALKMGILMKTKRSSLTCETFSVLFGISVTNSSIIVAAVGLERTFAVTAPFLYQNFVTRRRSFGCIFFTCLVFALLNLCKFVGCSLRVLFISSVVLISFCFVVTVVCYCLMMKVSRKHQRQIAALEQAVMDPASRTRRVRENRALKTATLVTVTYLICWVPNVVGMVLHLKSHLSANEKQLMFAWTATVFLLSSSLNPVIYGWRNRHIRQAMKRIMLCKQEQE